MSRFRFSLQRLLDLRRQHEHALAREVAVAHHAADTERERHDALRAAEAAARDSLARQTRDGVAIGTLQSWGLAGAHLGEHIEIASARHEAAQAALLEKHDALEAALQARRLLERLRERHLDHHTTETRRRDGTIMDAIALTRFTRAASDGHRTTHSASSQPPQPDHAAGSATRGGGDGHEA